MGKTALIAATSEIARLQAILHDLLEISLEQAKWEISTPLINGYFFLPHPDNIQLRAPVHDMVSFCLFLRDALRRRGEGNCLVSYDPQVVRSIKASIPQKGTAMISSTGCVWLLGTKTMADIEALRAETLALFLAWWTWYHDK